jgi:hypothetical protein
MRTMMVYRPKRPGRRAGWGDERRSLWIFEYLDLFRAPLSNLQARVECVVVPEASRKTLRMMTRFELQMRQDQRDRLGALARELDMSTAELLRLGARWVIANREMLLTGRAPAVPRKDAA